MKNETQMTAPSAKAAHTPWRLQGRDIVGQRNEAGCPKQIARVEGELDGEAIVRAVNNHTELLAALEALEAAATKFTIGCNCQTAGEDAILYASLETAREAIRKAIT